MFVVYGSENEDESDNDGDNNNDDDPVCDYVADMVMMINDNAD
jgi:hypothetical protein